MDAATRYRDRLVRLGAVFIAYVEDAISAGVSRQEFTARFAGLPWDRGATGEGRYGPRESADALLAM